MAFKASNHKIVVYLRTSVTQIKSIFPTVVAIRYWYLKFATHYTAN